MNEPASEPRRVAADDVLNMVCAIDAAADMGWLELQLAADALSERGTRIEALTCGELLALLQWARAEARKALEDRRCARAAQQLEAAAAATLEQMPGADGEAAQDGPPASAHEGARQGAEPPAPAGRPASVGEPGADP